MSAEYPSKFPLYVDVEEKDTVSGYFRKGPDYDDMEEAKRRWEQHQKLITLLREIRIFLSPPVDDSRNIYIKDLVDKIDRITE